ncbi:hypothetical protein AU252_12080 [Pseudarthrobacter sulfonivorans]|uniref:Uncharacterized protein n=1 Tax=Pseudarthrobacter sulfonivorans TaxID=121292 RepID=A0A0U3FDC5_9MICC|nr:hypothetical protein [Pseudarthrobacter sulfonivorans]ALV41801.1 hypothetical protein AU252_12080 [Pseudarthrobacter sulfonivorans]
MKLEQNNWRGQSDTMQVNGATVAKKTSLRRFLAFTVLAVSGALTCLIRFEFFDLIYFAGFIAAIVGIVASHGYRQYSHWIGLAVALSSFGTLVFGTLRFIGRLTGAAA